MFEMTQVHLSPTTRAAVVRMLKAQDDPRSVASVVEEALQAWLQESTRNNPGAAQAAARGYQWKSLFLPEGTCLRLAYRHQTYHAEVRGDCIIYQGQAYSPRQLLLHITGTVRNAWRELWLRGIDTLLVPREEWIHNSGATAVIRACLYRDDPVRAGRAGPRNRRHFGHLVEAMAGY